MLKIVDISVKCFNAKNKGRNAQKYGHADISKKQHNVWLTKVCPFSKSFYGIRTKSLINLVA